LSLHGQGRRWAPETGGEDRNSGREQGREAVEKAEKVVELLERVLKLTAEDDPVQPAVKHLNAALYEAEARLSTLENWCRRTYQFTKGMQGEQRSK
jgi:hypothetical protein